MNHIKRLIAYVGVAALMMGTLAGLSSSALADDDDTIIGSVSIACPTAATVELIGEQVDFAPITDITQNNDTSTPAGAIKLKVDMGCYLGPWQVNAAASRFESGTTWQSFSADHLSLEDPQVDSYFFDSIDDPFFFNDVLEPDASAAYFECSSYNPNGSCGEEILETSTNLLTFLIDLIIPGDWDANPAPFITEASYTGVLTDVPFLWGTNVYTSTITVELATD